MYSRLVSLKPPFFALASGVRIARVMTMSSAFLEVLSGYMTRSASVRFSCLCRPDRSAGRTHIEARELPGVRCLRMEPSRSTAMIDVCVGMSAGLLFVTGQRRSRWVDWVAGETKVGEGGDNND